MERRSLFMNETKTKTYHIYFKQECLFKDLSQEEFDIIWSRIYRSYFTEDITYTSIESDNTTFRNTLSESSY